MATPLQRMDSGMTLRYDSLRLARACTRAHAPARWGAPPKISPSSEHRTLITYRDGSCEVL